LILGIGGSMLGVQTILDSLYVSKTKKVICLDNIDPFVIQEITENLNLQKTLILVQTKSGSTPETLAQFFYFESLYKSQGLIISDHFVFVTDPKVGHLRKIANENPDVVCFDIDPSVGGRFCVLTAMGLVISELLDLDLQKMLDGAAQILTEQKSDCFQLAFIQSELYKHGYDQNVLMPYSSRLATFSRWYVQLLSESIGKKINNQGQIVNTGITPICALGATDQHSQSQLFVEGPYNKLILLLQVNDHKANPIIGTNLPAEFGFLQNVGFEKLLQAELQGTQMSLDESKKPNLTIQIEQIDEYCMGQLFMFFELSVAYIGEILDINAFDQPGVERAKILAKQILSQK
jgi:glucose-6-phosphate isomerase